MRRFLFAFCLLGFCSFARGAKMDTIRLFSPVMEKEMKCVVIVPDAPAGAKFNLLMLLHGKGGNHLQWPSQVDVLEGWADSLQMLVVCPQTDLNSWYLELPDIQSWRFQSYIMEDLLPFLEKSFPLRKSRKSRAIGGLSMGGHGAFNLALRFPRKWKYVLSWSGVLDIRMYGDRDDLRQLLGPPESNAALWNQFSAAYLLQTTLKKRHRQQFWVKCGDQDPFLGSNLLVSKILKEKDVSFFYQTTPGDHSWNYWKKEFPGAMDWLASGWQKKGNGF